MHIVYQGVYLNRDIYNIGLEKGVSMWVYT